MEANTALFHGSNGGLEVLGLCLNTGQPIGTEEGIYQKGLMSGLETSMTTNPKYAIHWGHDVLVMTSLEKVLSCQNVMNMYQSGSTYKFRGYLPSENITAFFLDSLLLSFASQDFLKNAKEQFPHTKIYTYSPDIHEKEANLPYKIFQEL